jgi:hypothetical protein
MQDFQGPLPAHLRHLRRSGSMPCCVASVQASKRLTRPGSEFQCQVCQAIYVVDDAGCWRHEGSATTLTLSSEHQ